MFKTATANKQVPIKLLQGLIDPEHLFKNDKDIYIQINIKKSLLYGIWRWAKSQATEAHGSTAYL